MKLNEIFMRDPFLFIEDGVAYLVGTTDHTAWSGKASGFLGYKSKDLENFDGPYQLFENNDDFWADENFWAPELHKYNGKYLLVASFKNKDVCRASQVLIADNPLGPYVPSKKPFTPSDWECLDATLYEENGKLYTIFSHEWTQIKDGHICVAQFNDDLSGFNGEVNTLFNASSAPWVIPLNDHPDSYVTDGPFLYKLKSGKLLMLWSSFGKDGYAMGMAVSDSGSINGRFRHIAEPIISKDGGHGMVFSFNSKTYITFHSPNGPFLCERPHFVEVIEKEDRLVLA